MGEGIDLRLGLLVRIFAVLSVLFVAALAWAPARDSLAEWRDVQETYNRRAASLGRDPVETGIRQIWNPELGVVDRCVTCHLGMGGGEPLPGPGPFGEHPPVPHDPEEIGCTVCHGGQGRARGKAAAPGEVAHGDAPLRPASRLEAGGGSCHTAIPVGSPGPVDRGRDLVARYDCLACHRIDGRGGGRAAPDEPRDLSGIGLSGIPEGWHEDHEERAAADPSGLFGEAYGPIPEEDLAAIEAYLETRVAMPRLAEGKRLFFLRGCLGCHAVNGTGGSEGADLTAEGRKAARELVFPAGFRGPRTAFAWQVEHLLAPAEMVEGSRMPDQGLGRDEAEKIALYLLSLRGRKVPARYLPPDRVRRERLSEREFGTDGATLYRVFCSSCHGPGAGGRPFGEMGEAFPAIAGGDFLAVASDAFLRKTIAEGRPGRRMAAWGGSEAGLRPAELRRLVAWLRSREPEPPSPEAVEAARPDAALGRRTWLEECAVCHGERGEGGIGPSLRSPAFGSLASPRFLYRTLAEGRPGTAMGSYRRFDAVTFASLIARVRSLSGEPLRPADPVPAGDAVRGGTRYEASCASCHGAAGEGGRGPAVGGPGFWAAADEGFLVASHLRGRCRDAAGDPVPPAEPRDLADVAAWLKARSRVPRAALEGRHVTGDPANGRELYLRVCAGCHGENGEGREAPALANEAFLRAANDGYLQATIARGRRGTAMPAFGRDQPEFPRLSGREIDDIVSFLRSLGGGGREKE